MKLTARDADGYFAKPDPDRAGLLIYGPDAMRVALKRQQVIGSLLGDRAEEEMRLTRMDGGSLRSNPAQLLDAVKAVGFFPGRRAVFVEAATDATAPTFQNALEEWRSGDASIIVTAGQLKTSSKLRKLFESHRNALAAAIYDQPPSRMEIERLLGVAGVAQVSSDAMGALTALSTDLGPGDFAQVLEKLALYMYDDQRPVDVDDVAAVAPQSVEAGLDDLINVVAETKAGEIGPLLRRLMSQGTTAITLCIATTNHYRTLYAAAADPSGPAAGIGKLRPPVYGPRRDRILRQAQSWGAPKLESALTELTNTNLALRSAGQTAPQMAVMERCLIRLSMMGRSPRR
jgi:DNA polymerase-3 subunit delta